MLLLPADTDSRGATAADTATDTAADGRDAEEKIYLFLEFFLLLTSLFTLSSLPAGG